MPHAAIEQVLKRAERAKDDSNFTYFFALLVAAEALAKTIVLGLAACIADDVDRHRYRVEHGLARADGMGDWGRALDDMLSGHASQYLLTDARTEQVELTHTHKQGAWQHDAVFEIKAALNHLGLASEDIPVKSDMRRWFRLFATLRNGTRAHGATLAEKTAVASEHLRRSIDLIYGNFNLFKRPWAYLYCNFSGKYRVSKIVEGAESFEGHLDSGERAFPNGIYLLAGIPRLVPLLTSDAELDKFYFPNGGFGQKRYELISYATDDKTYGDAALYTVPPGNLPKSETEGTLDLEIRGKSFTNAPEAKGDYVARPQLESELLRLLLDDKHPIITLLGKGGIGKTSLALTVLRRLYETDRFPAIIWFSARDVDLQPSGPKSVRPKVLSPTDMGGHFSSLVLSKAKIAERDFSGQAYLERQMQASELGPCLFVFDNFETTDNPVEAFVWIDTHIKSPNKVLITTRLRDFKGDYPVDVRGMEEPEARLLIDQTTRNLSIESLLTASYIKDLIQESEGHPYVIKILLGEVAKAGRLENVRRLITASVDILTALFERTYAALSPCAQRAFLTLSAWNSTVPRIALEAVLQRSTGERAEVERGIDSLLQFSMAERAIAKSDDQEFISLPMVSNVFGRRKLKVSPYKSTVDADVEILQMLGATRAGDVHLALASRLETFVENVARRVDAGESAEKYSDIIEMICRTYYPGWLIVARWYSEGDTSTSYKKTRETLEKYLEIDSISERAAEAWSLLARVCYRSGDLVSEVHAMIERAQIQNVTFSDISTAANRLNSLLKKHAAVWDSEDKRQLVRRLLSVMDRRKGEADSDDLSRMAWLAIHLRDNESAQAYVAAALKVDPQNRHCASLVAALRKSGRGPAGRSRR